MARLSKSDGDSSVRKTDFLGQYLQEYSQSEQVDVGQVLGWLLLNVRLVSRSLILCAIRCNTTE